MQWTWMDWIILTNDNVPNSFEGKEEPYTGPENTVDVD